MKFDVVVGNPPYQENIEHRGEQPSIYHNFIRLAHEISKKSCLITPGRFLFNVGSTPKEFNQYMLNNKNVKIIDYFLKSNIVFHNTDIKGGVVITYFDKEKTYKEIGVFTNFEELNGIIRKVDNENLDSINKLLYSNTSFKYTKDLYIDFPEFNSRLSGGSKRYLASSAFNVLPEIFYDEKPNTNDEFIKILGRQNNQRIYKYINKKYIKDHPNLYKYKIIVPSSNGSGALGEVLSTPLIGEPLIGEPLIGHTETFISFGAFDNRDIAENMLKYIKSKFARCMLGVLKVTQGNKTKHVWSKVPLQDFTNKSDIDWSKSIPEIDQQLYKKYNLSDKEINFIEEKVKAME